MKKIKAKKSLAQHFLKDENISLKIVNSLSYSDKYSEVLEIGPGMGMLTKYLIKKNIKLHLIELDINSVDYLKIKYPEIKDKIIFADFLKYKLNNISKKPFAVIGNFPYNISSQILFKILENKDIVPEIVGMFQKEVALRIGSKPNNKSYGIISVLLQAYYDIDYLFTVENTSFFPVPKVCSAVIRLTRNNKQNLGCDEVLFKKVVKTAFSQRRKMLKNTLKVFNINNPDIQAEYFTKRAENLNVNDFVKVTNSIDI